LKITTLNNLSLIESLHLVATLYTKPT